MKVSVYIPTKNRCSFLRRAVESVLQQTHAEIDLVVVDDASVDDTRKYLMEMERSGKLRAILNRNSYGACVSRNEAIEAARGLFVTGLDDDDFFLPDRINQFTKAWGTNSNSNEAPVAGLFDSTIVRKNNVETVRYAKAAVDKNDLKLANLIGNQVFAPRTHYLNAGLFDPQMPAWQDWDLWLRMADQFGSFINIGKKTYVVSAKLVSDGSISEKPEFIMRYASRLFAYKHSLDSFSGRSALTLSMLRYKQVMPTIKDICILFFGGHVNAGVRACARKSRLLPILKRSLLNSKS